MAGRPGPDTLAGMASPIAVVGAAGPTGLAAIRALTGSGATVRALVHRAEQSDDVFGAGAAEAQAIELDDPASLLRALEGAGAVLHIPPVFSAREPQQVHACVAAAAATAIERFVLHSVMHPATPRVRHHQRKAASEAIVRRSGLRWTILQPAMYAQTMMLYWRRSPTGTVIMPYSLDTPFTPVDLADVAAATAVVLTGDGHDFATYELGGAQVLTSRQMITAMCGAHGEAREVRRGELSELALPANWSDSARADMAAMCEHYDVVGLAGGGRVLQMLLGRAATPFERAIMA
jgi:NAD(P)H dehydrogenase (quinone)